MAFSHEKLIVYQKRLQFNGSAYALGSYRSDLEDTEGRTGEVDKEEEDLDQDEEKDKA